MRVSPSPRLLVMFALLLATSLVGGVVAAPLSQPNGPSVEVKPAAHQDSSRNLREVDGPFQESPGPSKEKPIRLVPAPGVGANPNDGAVQAAPGPQVASTPGKNFEGLGNGFPGFTLRYAPPDTVGAAGATQYVQWVNDAFVVFDKATGAVAAGFPKPGNALWQGFGGPCEQYNDGDPIVQYDKAAGRWLLTQFAVTQGTPYYQCVAISQTSDATGAYYRYSFAYTDFNDYPKVGIWPDAYYVTYNMFRGGSTFSGGRVCAWDRAKMLLGQAATEQCFQLGTSYGGLLPSDVDGATAPPAGAPNYVLNLGSSASLNLWKFHVDWGAPANTTLTGPTSIGVAAFSRACNGGTCIPQPGTRQQLDSLADRLMYRLAYRNFGSYASLVVNHAVSLGANKRNTYAGVRWYELRVAPGGTPAVYQQGTYAPDTTSRWMGSIAMDKVGNIALGYSASSSAVYPSVRYTARAPSDALGTLGAEVSVIAGTGSQTTNLSRWGDYSAMTLDPSDDCTFWYTNEYIRSNGTFNWNTRIASFKLAGCQ